MGGCCGERVVSVCESWLWLAEVGGVTVLKPACNTDCGSCKVDSGTLGSTLDVPAVVTAVAVVLDDPCPSSGVAAVDVVVAVVDVAIDRGVCCSTRSSSTVLHASLIPSSNA